MICPIAKEHRERRKIDEQARELRKRILAATGLVFLAIILIGSFLYLNYNLRQSERALRVSIAKNASIRAQYMISHGDVLDAIKLLLNVVPKNVGNEQTDVLPETEIALNEAYDSLFSDCACIAILNHHDDVRTAEFSEDSKWIVTSSVDGVCRIWKRASGELIKELKSGIKGMTGASFNKSGSKVVTSFSSGVVIIWDMATGKELTRLKGSSASVTYASFSPNEQYVLTSSKDKTVRLWNADTGVCEDTIVKHKDDVNCAVFSSDGKKVITASEDGASVVYDISSHTSHDVFVDDNVSIAYAEFSYDNTKIAVVTNDAVYIISAETGKIERVIKGHDDLISSATFAPNGKAIATSSHDKTIRLWDIDTGDIIHIYKGHSNTVSDVVFSPDGRFIISTSSDNEARLWNVPQDSLQSVIQPNMGILAMVTYSANGTYIAAASVMGQAMVWDVASANIISRFTIDERISSIAFSQESDKIIIISETGKATSFIVKTGEAVDDKELTTHHDSKDDNEAGQMGEWVGKGHSDHVLCFSYSHDKKHLISGSADNTAIIWDVESKSICHKLKNHSSQVYFVEFSPDGKYVLTASADGKAKLWNAITGTEVTTRNNALSPKYSLMFAPSGQNYIVSDGYDIRIYTYAAPKGLIDHFMTRYDTVVLTDEEKEYNSLK